jgi:hypothetical protein
MADQIYIGNFAKGLKLDRLPFNIDNDSFSTLFNAYAWRGRVKRKRGTSLLARLQLQVQSVIATPLNWQYGPITLVGGSINLFTFIGDANEGTSIVPGSISFITGGQTYTEPSPPDGTLIGTSGGSGTINYSTGVVTITGGASSSMTGFFDYFPALPVMGLEDYISNAINTNIPSTFYPLPIAFDTVNAYQLNQAGMPFWYNISYYKATNTPVVWSAPDYNQFWTTNYQSAFWTTNNKPGFNFLAIATITPGTITTIRTSIPTGLITGDWVFFNEITGTIAPSLNLQAFQITVTSSTSFTVAVNTAGMTVITTGIFQMLTSALAGQDGIRWYDGDPTTGTGLPLNKVTGWVNFMPPLTATILDEIDDQNGGTYYLVGALAILPFKDRLLFFSPWVQTSSTVAIQLYDTVLWSWNGTPYYNALVPTSPTATETFDVRAYYVDQTGFGGYLPAGLDLPIITVAPNEDVILIGFGGNGKKTRFVYTGNDLQPFLFYLINSEYPSTSTFSAISMDIGVIDMGQYGVAITTQQSANRIDLEIPDIIFQIQQGNNGVKRINSVRDFQKEWIYFCYPTGDGNEENSWVYPTQTLLYNYRDNTWAIFRENYTAHGTFRRSSNLTWSTLPFPTWASWTEPWNSGNSTQLFPTIIAGTPQGYVLQKAQGTSEGVSGYVSAIQNDGFGFTQITSFNHCVNDDDTPLIGSGDYLLFQGPIGLVSRVIDANNFVVDIPFTTVVNIINVTQAMQAVVSLQYLPSNSSYFVGQTVSIAGVIGMTELNGNTYTILVLDPINMTITLNVNTLAFTPYISGGTTTLVSYVGLADFSRLSQPIIQTKQFPFYWNEGRQTRLGVQKYLLDFTEGSQVTLNIYLSQDPDDVWNAGNIIPSTDVLNSSLIYSQILYTCPESTNLGLTPANSNLQMPTAAGQYQIWHRVSTSLQGDSIQLGITLSDSQMRNLLFATSEISLHGIQLNVDRGPLLS